MALLLFLCSIEINVREYRSGNQKGQSREIDYIGYTRRNKKQKKNTTQYALDTTIRKQAEITSVRHAPSYKQLRVKANRTSLICGNRN